MNSDPLEKELRDHVETGRLRLHDPAPAWKDVILAEAARARDHARRSRTPRWLLIPLGAAWGLIVVLHFSTPKIDEPLPSGATAGATAPDIVPSPGLTSWGALTVFNSHFEPADFP